jgi:hypothetical protein
VNSCEVWRRFKSYAHTLTLVLVSVYRLSTTYEVSNRNLTLDASSLASGVTLLAATSRRHFNVTNSGWLQATKVTFAEGQISRATNAYGGSLYFARGGSGAFSSCTWRNNSVTGTSGNAMAGGGGIYLTGRGKLALTGCTMKLNRVVSSSDVMGGALYVDGGGSLSLTRSNFTQNSLTVSHEGSSAIGLKGLLYGKSLTMASGHVVVDCAGSRHRSRWERLCVYPLWRG